jgi:site-specific recombinase XerD
MRLGLFMCLLRLLFVAFIPIFSHPFPIYRHHIDTDFMGKISFRFRKSQGQLTAKDKTKPQRLYMRLYVGGRQHWVQTPIYMPPANWDFQKQRVKPQAGNSLELNSKLNDVEQKAYGILAQGKDHQLVLKELEAIMHDKTTRSDGVDMEAAIELHLAFVKNSLAPNTLKKYHTLKGHLMAFRDQAFQPLYFSMVDDRFGEAFTRYLYAAGMQDVSVNKVLKNLKTLLKWSFKEGFVVVDLSRYIKLNKVRLDQPIAPTLQEVSRLWALDVSSMPSLQKVKDMAMILYYTGQRFSDLKKMQLKEVQNGVWKLVSKKTLTVTEVPLVGWASPAYAVIERNGYRIPRMVDVTFNRHIKTLGEMAGLSRMVQVIEFRGRQVDRQYKPLYTQLSSHTWRRACITHLKEKGLSNSLIMQLTGIEEEKTLKAYTARNTQALKDALMNLR